jgi:aminopeptidase N
MTGARQSFRFEGLASRPVPSILRDFSAPVILDRPTTNSERAFLLAHDTDPFNKWEAGRSLARAVIAAMIADDSPPDPAYLDGLRAVLRDDRLDPAFRALVLTLPSEDETAQALHDAGTTPDPLAIHHAHEGLRRAIARHLADLLPGVMEDCATPGPFRPDPRDAGLRSLSNAALWLLSRLDGGAAAAAQFARADNMTQQVAALSALLAIGNGQRELAAFEARWSGERLVMDKWFALQVTHAAPTEAAATAERLTRHPAFDWKNPNRFRSVFGALAGNAAGFHDPSGASYRLLADWLIRLDACNPQTAARVSTAFETWRRYDSVRQQLIREELSRIAAAPGLSRDTAEMVARMLG